MDLCKSEIVDLRYLRQYYGWDDKDARQVMQSIRETEHAARYYVILAGAHRAGYRQTSENGYMRLQLWCAMKGLPDPFGAEFDLTALDAMATDPRKRAA
jgi:hypothetical protein